MIGDIVMMAAALLLVLGGLFGLLAAIGVLRFPDLLTRLHAASLAGTVGGGLSFLAVMLVAPGLGIVMQALLGLAFLLLTTPVSAHLLAKISHRYYRSSAVDLAEDDLSA